MEEDIIELKQYLQIPRDISIIAHRNPDGDALGSSLGLKLFLERLGHCVTVVMPSEAPNVFTFLPSIEKMVIFDLRHDDARAYLDKADCIFCLDFNALDRIDKLGETINFATNKKVLIDHHLDPEPFADHIFSDTAASSTCELVYKFIDDLGRADLINEDIGTCLFTGLITDTGSFRYATRPYTYEVAAKLKAAGVDDYKLQDTINNSLKEKHLRLLGHCLANRMQLMDEYGVAIIALTRQDYLDYDIQRGDTEGIVNYLLMMRHIRVAAFITEQPTIVKMSLRSKGDISVQQIAANHFKGGGHKNAAGGGVYAKLDVVVEKFKSVIPDYLDKIEI